MKFYRQGLSIIAVSLSLVACGGGSTTTELTEGTLVVPNIASTKSFNLTDIKRRAARVGTKQCPNVPDGYSPLVNADVKFLDAQDAEIKTTKTDVCGKFSIVASNDIVKVKATSTGNKDLIADIKVFKTTNSLLSVASTIPAAAEYQISSIQIIDNKVAFSVTDTLTNHAVIGMPQSVLTTKINASNSSVVGFSNAANIADPASVTLVMDASGSMGYENVKDANGDDLVDPSDSSTYTRFRMAAIAAHTYLNNVPSGDETAITIFDHNVNFMDDAEVDKLFNYISTATGADTTRVPYTFSESGFTTEPGKLRLIVDSYNPESEIVTSYGNYGTPPGPIRKHSETPDLKLFSSVYPWGGATAAYDAMMLSLEKTDGRTNTRKIVIAMTDGEDNSGYAIESDVIDSANAKNIPVYTISFGANAAANSSLESIANATNASFFKVTGTDLVSAFSGIQSGITFQYLAELADTIEEGDTVELTLNLSGGNITRSITK